MVIILKGARRCTPVLLQRWGKQDDQSRFGLRMLYKARWGTAALQRNAGSTSDSRSNYELGSLPSVVRGNFAE